MSPRRGRSRGLSRNLGGHRIGAVGGTGERWGSALSAHRHRGAGVAHAFISVRALPAAMMRSEALFAKNLKFSGGRFSAESNHNLLNYSTVPPTVAS